jgi:hypothetical protein
LKIYTTFKDVQMILKRFYDISTGFRFLKNQCECSVHSCSCPWLLPRILENNKTSCFTHAGLSESGEPPPQDFCRSVKPIYTRPGGILCPPSDFQTFLWPCWHVCNQLTAHKTPHKKTHKCVIPCKLKSKLSQFIVLLIHVNVQKTIS